jgi:hypothetical protein
MDKLEEYLDQVCRSIGGPRALRQHVRQELSEHLRDAVAQHRVEGLSEAAALDKALEEFGKPDEVRSELEATHGRRLMAVVIDKAIEWKEITMKAKWLWTSWAYLALVIVIALELLFLYFNGVFIVPKFQKLMQDGIVDPAIVDEAGASWMPAFVVSLREAGRYTLLFIVVAAVAWGLFEWRVRSENKAFIRLSALGTVAVGLMVLVVMMAGSLVITFCLGAPAMGRMARSFAVAQIGHVNRSLWALEAAEVPMKWEEKQGHVQEATHALDKLAKAPGAAFRALAADGSFHVGQQLLEDVKAGREYLLKAQRAIQSKDAEQLRIALEGFHKSFEPVQEAAEDKTSR